MKKRVLLISLLLLLVFSIISCSSSSAELAEFIGTSDETLNLNGITWRFGRVLDYFMDEDSTLGYVDNTTFSDAAKERVKNVEDKYHFTLEYVTVDRIGEAVLQDSVTANSRFDIAQDEGYFLVDYIKAGLFTDYVGLSQYLDYKDSSKWGSPVVLESLVWDGGLYGVVPVAVPLLSYSSGGGVITANVTYIQSVGQEDPRVFYENGEWTWDKLEELLPLYTVPGATEDETTYGMLSGDGWLARSFFLSNCEGLVYKDTDGSYKSTAYTDAGIRALEEYRKVAFGEFKYTILSTLDSVTEMVDSFASGSGALANFDAYQIYSTSSSVAYKMDNFAILPFPTGPDMPAGTITSLTESVDYATCIPLACEYPEASATIIDALYAPFEGYETDESMISYLKGNYFYNDEDARIFVEMSKKTTYMYLKEKLSDAMFLSIDDKTTVTEVLDKQKDQIQSIIDEEVVPRISTIDELFGG